MRNKYSKSGDAAPYLNIGDDPDTLTDTEIQKERTDLILLIQEYVQEMFHAYEETQLMEEALWVIFFDCRSLKQNQGMDTSCVINIDRPYDPNRRECRLGTECISITVVGGFYLHGDPY